MKPKFQECSFIQDVRIRSQTEEQFVIFSIKYIFGLMLYELRKFYGKFAIKIMAL